MMTTPKTPVGHQITTDDDPFIPKQVRDGDAARRKEWVDAFNAKYKTVDRCTACNRDLIAEEVVAHRLSYHTSEAARPIIGMIEQQPEAVRSEIAAYIKKYLA